MSLYFLILLLLILAGFFVAWPYVIKNKQRKSQSLVSLEVFQERLADLEAEKAAGNISEDVFEKLKEELTLTLSTEVDDDSLKQATTLAENKLPKWVGLGAMAMLVSISVVLYAVLGSSKELASKALMDDFKLKQMQFMHGKTVDLLSSAKALEAELKKEESQAESWYILARTYMELDEFPHAEQAFLTVIDLVRARATPQELAGILGQYAQANYFNNDQQLTEQAENALNEALALNPEEMTSLSLIGISAFKAGQYERAIEYWQRVLKVVGPNSPNARPIIAGINNARAKLGQTPEDPASMVAEKAPTTPHVSVKVDIAETLKNSLPPSTTVFVFARPTDGSRMPLAAKKLTLGQLPTTLHLDDASAMGPMAKISSVEAVHVGAVATQSGTPGAKPGDLSGEIQHIPVATDDKVHALVIDTLVE